MSPEQFCYWLQGFAEIHGDAPTDEQWQKIRDHLQTVYHKVTPIYPSPIQFPGIQPGIVTC